jgi:hypothetical protein
MKIHQEWIKQNPEYIVENASNIEQGLLHILPELTTTVLAAEGTFLKALSIAWLPGDKFWSLEAYVRQNDQLVVLKTDGSCVAGCLALLEAVLERCNRGDALPRWPSSGIALPVYHFGRAPEIADEDRPF